MKDDSIKVSVVIPVYNSKKYLKACLESVLEQTLRGIEVIIVDDGSTDGSWSLVEELSVKDRRIKALRQHNQGVSAARNTGLKLARGEYVGFVDSDDYVDAGYFENLYKAAILEKADIVTGYVSMDDEKRQHFYNYTSKRTVMQNKNYLMGVVWLNLYRKSLLDKNNILFPAELRTAEDNIFNLQASYYANKVVRAKDDTVFYHQTARDGSLTTQQYNCKNLLQLTKAVHATVTTLNSLNGYSKEVYISRFIDTLNYLYQRYIKAASVGLYTRYKISFEIMNIWKDAKYRKTLSQAIKDKEINLEVMMFGWLPKRFYMNHILNVTDSDDITMRQELTMKLHERKNKIKTSVKEAVRSALPYGFVNWYKQRHVISGSTAPDEKKIGIVAAYGETTYVALLKESVKKSGHTVSKYAGGAKYVWLHWYENGVNDYADFHRKISMIKAWKDQGKKIILHVHNKKPHESAVPNLSHALMTVLYDSVDHIAIMNNETKNLLRDRWYYGDDFSRVSTVPHPNYIGAYGKKLEMPTSLKNDTLKILFFGQVRPYKGVEKLLEATEGLDNIEISILGTPKDDQYVDRLHALCANRNNVTFRLEHIPDSDIPQVFAEHHIVALPYNIDSSLNSGAAILALSYARTVVGTNNGTLRELGDDSLYFGYDYRDEQDHVDQLKKTIQSIHQQYSGKYNNLLEIGEKAFQRVEKDNSIDTIAASIKDMIKRIG